VLVDKTDIVKTIGFGTKKATLLPSNLCQKAKFKNTTVAFSSIPYYFSDIFSKY
jgi:hypothetical protein